MTEAATRCGFVALIGAPNAGKSTLLNTLVGTKVAIVSPKVQTTRSRVLGIATEGATQIVFVDTPGIFKPRRRLDRAMVAAAWAGAAEGDLVLLLVDSSLKGVREESRAIVEKLAQTQRKAILILNKIDAVRHEVLLTLAADLNASSVFTDTFMISALTGSGVNDLRRHLAGHLPEGPWLFPEDQVSDMPMRLLAAEITREKLFLRLQQELPYAVAVETEDWEEQKDGSVRISQIIYVQRNGQKAIVLGHGGQMIKAIGTAARLELEEITEQRVHLSLFVKVRENWLDDPARYSVWGLDYDA
ncbi:GTP-binding protein Era [Inquilinus ginsengisoli]|uniref:GTPase Era n=1 Tax=Inquilinus ginsengisoli TaxID=363840 RepID=UPI003D204899